MGGSRGRAAILVFQALLVSACAASPPAASPPPPPCPTIAPTPPPAPPPSVATAPPPVVLPPSIPDTPAEHALAQVFADAWDDQMREVPTLASTFGDRRFNDRWPEVSEDAFLRRRAHATDYLARLQAIPQGALCAQSQLNRALFEREYTLAVEGYAHGFDGFSDGFKIGGALYAPITPQDGIQIAGDLARQLRFETAKDYEDWLRRMETFPAYVDETISIMREGMKRALLYPRVVMQRVSSQIDRQIVTSPEQSPFFKPFTHFPAGIADEERARMSAAAKRAITARIVPAFQTLKAFFTKDYLPACFDQVGIWQIPHGDEAYRYLVRLHTTTDLDPKEIHEIGLREVARIRDEMQKTMEKTGFKGTLKDFFVKLRTDPRFFYKTPEDLEEAYRATAKRIDPLLIKLFKTLPRTPYGVEPVPASRAPEATTAYYVGPAEDGSRAGTYFVNLYKPEARPTWEMMALTMHESVPGHHLQIALAQERGDVPEFRRHAQYTAFVEGWGLYAESLGDEVGLYDDPYAKFGQLAYEMWRAVRLVVDTGMHAMKWDRQKAIDFFLDNDPKTPLDVTNEIDRYIVTPGQALAYKIGELKIHELRARAKTELGARFDVREFHDAVLEQGAVPLDVLERHINEWIASKKPAP
ncbi:MAG: DUF885 domain-containing protein [Polyangiaceae bacterium]